MGRGLTKTYRTGEIEVNSLRGAILISMQEKLRCCLDYQDQGNQRH